jgi:asparagine synthase (glutamine-hydrolysing)
MCGIIGYIAKSVAIDSGLFEKMVDTLVHRGPDDKGIYYDKNVNLAFGHRRLSIIDLSPDGHQPMHYIERYTIVFNGEIFNYIELKEELISFGYKFNSKSDTEVVLAAYDKWGEDCLNKFNGMWSIAIYDKIKKNLFCARDRFGVKPFYYYFKDNIFIFASEIKAILPFFKEGPKANVDRLLDNIMYNLFDHTSETMFQNVNQLRPGFLLVIDENFQISTKQYYNIENITYNINSYEKNVEIFKSLFYDSIKLRLRADVPVGSCLSGGLDSSSIVCVTAELLKNHKYVAHHTISSCYNKEEEKKFDEQEYIDEVTTASKTICHKTYPEVTNFFRNFNDIIYHQDEPVGGLCHESQYNVFRAAHKENITVMLDGQGADEQLAGYAFFHSEIVKEFLRSGKIFSALKEIYYFKKLRSNTEIYGLKGLFYFVIKDFLPQKIQRKFIKLFTSREEFAWLKVPYSGELVNKCRTSKTFDESIKQSLKYGLVQLLHFEDRNSMASSIEGRTPFLDYRLVEHIVSLPPSHKLKDGITKRVLRDSMKGIIPEKIRIRTSKLGFAVPVELWIMKNPQIVKMELENAIEILQPLFDKDKIMAWFEKNINNEIALKNDFIWRLISAGRWVKLFNVKLN